MIQATTPVYTFNIPFDTSLVKTARVTFAQNDEMVLRKETADCVMDGSTIKTTLTQEETLLFEAEKRVQIQLRVQTTDNAVMSSDIYAVSCKDALDEEVLL